MKPNNAVPCLTFVALIPLLGVTSNSVIGGFGGRGEEYEQTIDKTVGEGAISGVRLRNINGGINISAWENPNVRVVAKKTVRGKTMEEAEAYAKEKVKVEMEQKGESIEIITEMPKKQPRNIKSASVEYKLYVPKLTTLDISTVNGGVEVKDALKEKGVQVSLATTNGSVSLRGGEGQIEAKTKNGNIELAQISGELMANTVNGNISATMLGVGASPSELGAINGSIELSLPADAPADIEASCVNGSVRTDLPIVVKGKMKRTMLEGKLNGGGVSIKINTINGSVHIVGVK